MGLTVEMPRTPAVFPPKNHWSLKEQMVWGGASEQAQAFKGLIRDNYPSAKAFAVEVEKVLEDQARRGQVLVLTEEEAKRRYRDRLTVASLGAMEKGQNSDGETN